MKLLCSCILAALIISMFSCKKDNEIKPEQAITGFWKGEASNQDFSEKIALLFRTEGTVRMYNFTGTSEDTAASSTFKADGNYSVNEKNVRASLSNQAVTVTSEGTLNDSLNRLSGSISTVTISSPFITGIFTFNVIKQ